jgi:hypothetical protein
MLLTFFPYVRFSAQASLPAMPAYSNAKEFGPCSSILKIEGGESGED